MFNIEDLPKNGDTFKMFEILNGSFIAESMFIQKCSLILF